MFPQTTPDPSTATIEAARSLLRDGRQVDAERVARELIDSAPQSAPGWELSGDIASASGRTASAVEQYARALELEPDCIPLAMKLAVALAQHGRHAEAEDRLHDVVRLAPGHPPAHMNLGVLLAKQGRLQEAADSLRRATELDPNYADAHRNLGNALKSLSRHSEALDALSQAARLRPEDPDNLTGLGLALLDVRRAEESLVFLQQAARLRGNDTPEGLCHVASALLALGRGDEAESCCQHALRIKPGFAPAHLNLGMAHRDRGRISEAIACFDLALLLDPNQPSAQWNRALALLQKGEYECGWTEYECRLRRPHAVRFRSDRPVWNGSPLNGRSILVHSEQGLGDVLQFVRYFPMLKPAGAGGVYFICPTPLLALAASCAGIDRVIPENAEPPPFDLHLPLMSLPHRFRTTLATLPSAVPYLQPDSGRVERWQKVMAGMDGLKVGIVWQGNPHHEWDQFRSIPLEQFAPLARLSGVRLVSLQRIFGREQLKAWGPRLNIIDPNPDAIDRPEDFADTAALIRNLDLVVTVDTAAAHLAGAIGARVWLVLAARSDWRWLSDRSDSPWYPTMRVFRQPELGQWTSVFERIAVELAALQSGRSACVW